MLIRIVAIVLLSTLATGLLAPADPKAVYLIVLVVTALVLLADRKKKASQSTTEKKQTPKNTEPDRRADVVDLAEFRNRKKAETGESTGNSSNEDDPENEENAEEGLEMVFESNSVIEADLVNAMFEHHGLNPTVLNRQNATILIHPMGEFTVKIAVPSSQVQTALKLLAEADTEGMDPDDSVKSTIDSIDPVKKQPKPYN